MPDAPQGGAERRPDTGPPWRTFVRVARLLYHSFISISALALVHCSRTGKVVSGTYEIADQEYSSQNYVMLRKLESQGGFEERHILNRCLRMEMTGKWEQKGGNMVLNYAQARNRDNCSDSMPAWSVDTSRLSIPIRNVEGMGYEALLAATDTKSEKWIKWMKTE